jgi:DNA integrity scanning protein DisA with diadenylate cyclase activity
MKRVKAACICQILHFMLKDGEEHLYAVKQVKDEVEKYKRDLERNHTQYKIVEQTEQPDGSIIVKVIKQYNSAPVGDYLN